MEIKEYQQKTLNILREYLQELDKARAAKEAVKAQGIDLEINVPEQAWRKLRGTGLPGPRKNGLGEDLPSICFKVPTGGGKTYLATLAIDIINTVYRKSRTGFVLWLVPTTQIYSQTLASLRNREHPYRQALDRASGGKTLIIEKTDRFTPSDLQEYLVVMLLMLPAANRLNKETLKLFQDSGGFEDFFPDEGKLSDHTALLEKYPNLDYFGDQGRWRGAIVKSSLGNTLRVIQPIIILDEGHKAYSEGAQNTINGFNPSFVLELSATPKSNSNVLVTISGQELDREEMIKLDLNVYNQASWDWRSAMLAGWEKLGALDKRAVEYHANKGRYIRPICLIQVERVGKTQEGLGFVHVNDVKSFLMTHCEVPEEQIRIKTGEEDGLEDTDLLDPDCQVRYIITKQALQEGWDCAFAYVLVILTNPGSESGITQLVGRILRQPYARKTRIRELDESYVFCFQRKAQVILGAIRRGFSDEGLDDMAHRAREIATSASGAGEVEIGYRPEFKKFEGKVYLPHFVVQETGGFRELSYEMDIASRVDWSRVRLDVLDSVTLSTLGNPEDRQSRIGFREGTQSLIDEKGVRSNQAVLELDRLFVVRQIADIIPNPWVAYSIVSQTLDHFLGRYDEETVAYNLVLIIDELKRLLLRERDKLAEEIFRDLIKNDKLCFFLQAIREYQLPRSIRVPAGAPRLVRDDNSPIQQSLFEYQPEDDFNGLEKSVAVYLDEQTELLWWYRNLTGKDYYSVQGWRKHRIWPDFVTTRRSTEDRTDYSKVIVLETKGLHLKGNADTTYKSNIFDLCNELGRTTTWEEISHEFRRDQVEFQVIYGDEWKVRVNALFL